MLQEGNSKLKCRTDNNADSIKIPLQSIVAADNIIDSVFDDPTTDMTQRESF